MSTDLQQYSIENQHAAIQAFADARAITIVRSFIDDGRSGVAIQGRDVLQQLLRTVEGGQPGFSTILVYDVSRWGRFQEPDEGAYYEFRCNYEFRCILANVTVQYCAEQFPTDSTPMSAVMKSFRRDWSYLAVNRALRLLHGDQIGIIKEELLQAGASVQQDPNTDLLTVNEEFTVALIIARCREIRESEYRWVMRFDTSLDPDITIGARMAAGNTTIMDYYLFPAIDGLAEQCRLAPENGIVLDVYRVANLAPLVNLLFWFSVKLRQ